MEHRDFKNLPKVTQARSWQSWDLSPKLLALRPTSCHYAHLCSSWAGLDFKIAGAGKKKDRQGTPSTVGNVNKPCGCGNLGCIGTYRPRGVWHSFAWDWCELTLSDRLSMLCPQRDRGCPQCL